MDCDHVKNKMSPRETVVMKRPDFESSFCRKVFIANLQTWVDGFLDAEMIGAFSTLGNSSDAAGSGDEEAEDGVFPAYRSRP
jgi:hypothetical protein